MWASLEKVRCILDRSDSWKLVRLLLAVGVMVLLELAGLFSVLPFMRVVAQPDLIETNPWLNWINSTFDFSSRRELLAWLGVAVLALYAFTAAISVFTTWLIERTIWGIGQNISMRLINRYARMPFEFFLSQNSSTIVKKAVSDIRELVTGVLLAGVLFLANVFKSMVILLLLFFVNPKLALLAFTVFGGSYLLIHAMRHRPLRKLGQQRQQAFAQRLRAFTETLSGIRTLRVSGATGWFVERFETASRSFYDLQPVIKLYNVFPRHLIELIAFGGIVSFVVYLLITGQNLLEVLPVLTVFAVATYKLMPSLNLAFNQAANVSHFFPVIDAVHEDMHEEIALLPPTQEYSSAPPIQFKDRLTLSHISFQYAATGVPVLQNVDLEIAKTSKCAFVGSTGCGKSTLIDIMVGLLSPTSGTFSVDGTPITRENVFGWQKILAYVPQDVFLYDDTIAANIALGIPPDQRDEQLLRRAAELAQIDRFVTTELREGYNTVVGEGGVRLSGGERQRIGLARAFYRQPEVLFLDEATSALDSVTEEAVVSAIQHEMPDVTVLMISHRLNSIKFCDQVMLIDAGRLVDQGSFEDLMKTNAKFREMVEIAD